MSVAMAKWIFNHPLWTLKQKLCHRRRGTGGERGIVPSKLARSSSERASEQAAKSRNPVLSAIIIYSVLVPPPSSFSSFFSLFWRSSYSADLEVLFFPAHTYPSFSLLLLFLALPYNQRAAVWRTRSIFVPRDFCCASVVLSCSKQSLIMFHGFPQLRQLFLTVRELCHFAERSEER